LCRRRLMSASKAQAARPTNQIQAVFFMFRAYPLARAGCVLWRFRNGLFIQAPMPMFYTR
jgi:hypothetical protein